MSFPMSLDYSEKSGTVVWLYPTLVIHTYLSWVTYLQSLASNLCISLSTIASSPCLPLLCVRLHPYQLRLHTVCLVLCSNLDEVVLSLPPFSISKNITNSPLLKYNEAACVCVFMCIFTIMRPWLLEHISKTCLCSTYPFHSVFKTCL